MAVGRALSSEDDNTGLGVISRAIPKRRLPRRLRKLFSPGDSLPEIRRKVRFSVIIPNSITPGLEKSESLLRLR